MYGNNFQKLAQRGWELATVTGGPYWSGFVEVQLSMFL